MKLLIQLFNRLLATALGQAIFAVPLAKHKQLCAELLWMAYRDQKAGNFWARSTKKHTVKDLEQVIQLCLSNTRRMKEIVEKHGWPGRTLVGDLGCQAAWLLIQHADHDPAFQKQCLVLLETAVEKNEAPASHLAYLTDRIRVGDGREQIFGTQLHGSMKPLPIEDEDHVDERRAKVDLPPLSEYLNQIKQVIADHPALPDRMAEMKQLSSQLPPSPEYDRYVEQMKRFLSTIDAQ